MPGLISSDLRRPAPWWRLPAVLVCICGLAACGGGDPAGPGSTPAPGQVTDLSVVAGSATSVTLAWTVPGAALKKGGSLTYDLRYIRRGEESADRALWTVAPRPAALAAAGQRQQHLVAGLAAGTTYVFSLSASYDGATWSDPSAFAVGTAAPQPDATPPARPTDLVQYRGDATSVTVAWSLAGDDSIYGRAAAYEVRYSTTPLTPANWDEATVVTAPPAAHPNPAKLTATIDGLADGRTCHVGVVAVDDVGNVSGLSNVVVVQTGAMRTLYVRPDGAGDYPTLNDAIHAALPGDVVLVAPGRYTWTGQGDGDATQGLFVVLRDQTDFTIRGEAGAAATILDAERQGRVMYVTGGTFGAEPDRTWAGVTIEGFTFTNGRALGVEGELGPPWAGAGLALHLTDTLVRDCVFRGNEAVQGGAVWMGGQGGSRLENCLIEGNRADAGGGVMLINSEPVMGLSGCVLRNNHAATAGGGLFAVNVGAVFENLQVYGNDSDLKGGGVSLSALHAGSLLEGCTIVGNAGTLGAGLRVVSDMTIEMRRCLLAFNLRGAAYSTESGGAVAAGCCLVFGNAGGNTPPPLYTDLGGNLTIDPLLCADGLHPSAASPCLPGNRAGGDACGQIGALGAGCGG